MSQANVDFVIHTWGCKVNTYDSGLLESRMRSFAESFSLEGARRRVHLLNTCAVTREASREAERTVRRLRRREPDSFIVLTGCAAQVDGALFDELSEVDLVVGNSHKGKLEDIVANLLRGRSDARVHRSNIFLKSEFEPGGGVESSHTRAFLKIQDGCNSFCSYCIIPFARGRSRSLAVRELVARVQELYEQGVREVVLTGVHIGDYKDPESGSELADLIEALLTQTAMPRFRLTSLEPPEVTPRVLSLFKDNRLCPHFHMSIQSATSSVLRNMRRTYSSEHVETALERIADQVPGAFVGMDVIAGFQAESATDFEETCQRLERLPWTRLHVFPYSERPGTKALTIGGTVPLEERAVRAQRLRELSEGRLLRALTDQFGKNKKVLVTSDGTTGVARDYWAVSWVGAPEAVGSEVDVKIIGFEPPKGGRTDGRLLGQVNAALKGPSFPSAALA